MADAILQVQEAGKIYPGGTQALLGANLTVRKGEFVCLIGASGCGKSTLLRMIGGFETVTSGRILMHARPVAGPGPDRGMVFQDYGLFPWLTVRGNIAFGPIARGRPKAQALQIADQVVADARGAPVLRIELAVRGAGRVDHQALGIADVGQMREQAQALDKGPPCVEAAFDAEGQDAAGTVGQIRLDQVMRGA